MVSWTTTGFMHVAGLADEAYDCLSGHVNRGSVCFACSMHCLSPGATTLLYLHHTSSICYILCCMVQLTECVTLVVQTAGFISLCCGYCQSSSGDDVNATRPLEHPWPHSPNSLAESDCISLDICGSFQPMLSGCLILILFKTKPQIDTRCYTAVHVQG